MWIYVGLKMARKIVKENWEQGIHVDIKGSNILLKLVNLCGTQRGKQSCKKNWEQGIHGWYECSNIYQGLFDLWWDLYDKLRLWEWDMIILMYCLKIGRLVMWEEYYCEGKQAREKWMRHELICIYCLKLESLHMKLNGEFILIKKISCMT